MTVGILGGGLAGLSVAAHLDHGYEVLERDRECGGHCLTIEEDGFTWDGGGPHIIFSRNQRMVDYIVSLLAGNVLRRRRNNKIFFKGRYVKYPFENGLDDLEPQDRFECLYHYLYNDHPKPANFKEWLYHTFGTGLTEKYLLPYNEKIWNCRAEELGLDWVEGRVPKPPVEDVIKAAVGVETEGYTHQLYYHYPERGGIVCVPRSLEARVKKITTGFEVLAISRRGARWVVSDGRQEREYDRIVATIPLLDLATRVEGVPADVVAAVRALRCNSLIVVGLGLATVALPDYTAVYIPDPGILTHRISFPGAFSPRNVPPGRSMVNAEITANAGDGVWELSDDAVVKRVIDDLDGMGVIRRADVCYARAVRDTYGYVVQDAGYRKNLAVARAWFEAAGLLLCGRVAEHEYINMDVAIERGMAVAHRLNAEGP
ncbi:MAG: FAD-dependent oxidoreductase [Candidatus Rokubacteria bacterium]|nr:FAD-dependent oxidoreductase [Candidatus Rokubacteria bacterium]